MIDDYWREEEEDGEMTLHGEPYAVRWRIHSARERRSGEAELLPVPRNTEAIYYQGAASYVVPRMELTVALGEGPAGSGAIGRVEGAEYTGVRLVPLGAAQGWHYPALRTVMLRECLPEGRYRTGRVPLHDPLLRALWGGWERLLLARSGGATRIATPAWEPEVERAVWHRWLLSLGYAPYAEGVWSKEVVREQQSG